MEFLPESAWLNTQSKGLHRQLEVALWLREFRYSSPAVLGRLVHIKGPYNGQLWRFLNTMKRRGWIQDFSNTVAPQMGRLFMAGPEMAGFLETHGLEHSGVVTNPVYVRHCKTTLHDLNLQFAIVELKASDPDKVAVVESEIQLRGHSGWLKPDAIVTNAAGKKVAFEYEMTRKASNRIYHTFSAHLYAIQSGLYSGVKYLFPNERICETYRTLFASPSWPNTQRDESGRVYQVGAAYNPDLIEGRKFNRAQCISFGVECHLTVFKTGRDEHKPPSDS